MKIGFVLDDTLDVSDGVQQAVLTSGEYLKSLGHDIHYLASETHRTDIDNIHSLAKVVRVSFNGNKMRRPLPVSKSKIKKFLTEQAFDVLHIQMPYSPLFAEKVLLGAPNKTKLIGTFHILPYSNFSSIAARALGVILWRSLKKFDSIISVSEPAKLFCKNVFRVDSVVIPNPVNIDKFKNNIVSGNEFRRIVFLGRLVERKGVRELIQAYDLLLSSHPELTSRVKLIVAGKGELKDDLKNIVKKLSSDHIIEFMGFIKEEDKSSLLATADIAVFPSKGGESFGIVLIEAMASGSRLVLAGDNPGYHSVMHRFPRLLVDPNDTHDFADRLFELLEDSAENRNMTDQLSQEVDQYDVSVVCSQLLKLYSS